MKSLQMVTVGLITLGFLSGCGCNSLKTKDEHVQQAWQNVESACRQRADLVSRYVWLASAFEGSRDELLQKMQASAEQIMAQKRSCGVPESIREIQKFQVEQEALNRALAMFMAEEEHSTRLASDPRCYDLYRKLIAGESRINSAVVNYNTVAHDFNLTRRGFPQLLANIIYFRYADKVRLTASEGVRLVIDANDAQSCTTQEQACSMGVN